MTPTFKLPDGFTLPDGGSEDQFEALVTLRRLPDGSVAVVALDGIDLPVADEPSPEASELSNISEPTADSESKSKYQDLPPELDFADAIETQLDGVSPSQIHF
jgi:hypothetical protein